MVPELSLIKLEPSLQTIRKSEKLGIMEKHGLMGSYE